jgi:hypothetical protein
MPQRLTVAGEATARSCTSKMRFMEELIWMISPAAQQQEAVMFAWLKAGSREGTARHDMSPESCDVIYAWHLFAAFACSLGGGGVAASSSGSLEGAAAATGCTLSSSGVGRSPELRHSFLLSSRTVFMFSLQHNSSSEG